MSQQLFEGVRVNACAIDDLAFSGGELRAAVEAALAFLADKRAKELLLENAPTARPAKQARAVELSPATEKESGRDLRNVLDDAFKAHQFCEQERALIVEIACNALVNAHPFAGTTAPVGGSTG